MKAQCVQIFVAGLGQLAQRTAEMKSFCTCSYEAETDNQREAAQITADFENSRRQKIVEMQQIADADLLEAHITSCHEQAEQFSENLMSLELHLVNKLKDIFQDYEWKVSERVGGFTKYVKELYPFSNKAKQKYFYFMGKLLVDKDTVTNAVSASHYTHLQKIDDRENELLARINSWKSSLLKSVLDYEHFL
ncbi:hypothetical protein PO909_002132 [Leuciscus waleckii]